MTLHPDRNHDQPMRCVPRALGIACLLLAVTGCTSFWDEMLSNERDMDYAFPWRRPDPLVVLSNKNSNDGVRRQQALVDIKEPRQNGGTAKDQEAVLNILATVAKTGIVPGAANNAADEPGCRLAAIGNLGKWKDPRAARVLEEVYTQQTLHFTPELNSKIRQQALRALENGHDPEAWRLLVRVARQPGPSRESNLTDRQQTQDEKTIAIRALGNYKDAECVDALKFVLRTEKDIALRDLALASLQESTNKKWPEKREVWQAENVQPVKDVPDGYIQRVGAWFTSPAPTPATTQTTDSVMDRVSAWFTR